MISWLMRGRGRGRLVSRLQDRLCDLGGLLVNRQGGLVGLLIIRLRVWLETQLGVLHVSRFGDGLMRGLRSLLQANLISRLGSLLVT